VDASSVFSSVTAVGGWQWAVVGFVVEWAKARERCLWLSRRLWKPAASQYDFLCLLMAILLEYAQSRATSAALLKDLYAACRASEVLVVIAGAASARLSIGNLLGVQTYLQMCLMGAPTTPDERGSNATFKGAYKIAQRRKVLGQAKAGGKNSSEEILG